LRPDVNLVEVPVLVAVPVMRIQDVFTVRLPAIPSRGAFLLLRDHPVILFSKGPQPDVVNQAVGSEGDIAGICHPARSWSAQEFVGLPEKLTRNERRQFRSNDGRKEEDETALNARCLFIQIAVSSSCALS
jgi:hypothetical protein